MTQHTLNHISPHVYWLSPAATTDRPTLGVIAGSHSTLIVDAGNSPAHVQALLNAVANLGIAPPNVLALTHWHWDHVFGTAALALPTFSHVETQRVVREMAQFDWSDQALDQRVAAGVEIAFCRDMIKAELPDRSNLTLRPPQIAFTDRVELDLGGVTCQIVHVGGDHAADSTIVYVPEDRIMFLGDCMYPDIYHPKRRYTVGKLRSLLQRLQEFDAECYLGGHDLEPISRADMATEIAMLTTISQVITQHGVDRTAIMVDLQQMLPGPLTDDHFAIVDEFIAGLDIDSV